MLNIDNVMSVLAVDLFPLARSMWRSLFQTIIANTFPIIPNNMIVLATGTLKIH